MRIREVTISAFEIATVTPLINMTKVEDGSTTRWYPQNALGHATWWQTKTSRQTEQVHVMHVRTDDGLEGVCTVGDVRYRVMTERELVQLRELVVGEDAADRDRLDSKLHRAARFAFTRPGWAGAFDNCLWDIAGKAAGVPVADLIGRARPACPAYYNSTGNTIKEAVEDSIHAIELGFPAVKDHFAVGAAENCRWFASVRREIGQDIVLMHDGAENAYTYAEALQVGRALEEHGYLWFEEPLSDRDHAGLRSLCRELTVPVLAPETLMHDRELCTQWLTSGAVDELRCNARHGTTPLLRLAHLAHTQHTTVELNGPGGLFGIVHAHLCCAIGNTRYYEYFPGGSRDEAGKEIGLTNPAVPVDGRIAPPSGPGWGAEWDWPYFLRRRVAVL